MEIDYLFGNKAVIQCGQPFYIRGKAKQGEKVRSVLKGNNIYETESICDDQGAFLLSFPAVKGGFEEFSLSFYCNDEKIIFEHIVFGNVFLLAGQSNMEYPLEYIENAEQESEQSGNSLIRYLNISNGTLKQEGIYFFGSREKNDDCDAETEWMTAETFEKAELCSGFGFLFAAAMFQKTHIPIGLINVSVGGSSIEAFLPQDIVSDYLSLKFYKEKIVHEGERTNVGCIFNQKIYHLRFLRFTGVLWYLGESSAWSRESAEEYERGLAFLIAYYRTFFDQSLKFILIHIGIEYYSPFGVNFVNRSLSRVAEKMDGVVECPIYDLPHRWFKADKKVLYHPIHITSKKESAVRAANLFYDNFVLNNGQKCPSFSCLKREGSNVYVEFKNCGIGLTAMNGMRIYGFAVAGENGKFFEAFADIISYDTVKVYSPAVSAPQYCSYAFAMYNNHCNLSNGMYPAIPFLVAKDDFVLSDLAELYPALSCCCESQFETAFGTNNGGAWPIPTWEKGRLFAYDNVKVAVLNDFVEVKFGDVSKNYYYIGVSCRVDVAFLPNIHSDKTKVKIEIVSSADIEFSGYHVMLSDGTRMCFCAYKNGVMVTALKIEKNKQTVIEIGLEEALLFNDTVKEVDVSVREKISYGQFTFRSFCDSGGTIYIRSVYFY